jgi:hypothetical protein
LKGTSRSLIDVLSRNLPAGAEANPQETLVSIVGVSTEIRNGYLPNTSVKNYRYANPLDAVTVQIVFYLTVTQCRKIMTFRRNILPQSSELNCVG